MHAEACSPKPLFAMYSGVLGPEVAGNSVAESCSNVAAQCAGWKTVAATTAATPPALQATTTPWTSSEYSQQQERSPQPLSYSATADVYMQTLCPSYTMLTYTHAPLLTNFGVSPTYIYIYIPIYIYIFPIWEGITGGSATGLHFFGKPDNVPY